MFKIPQFLLDSTSAAQFAKNPAAPGWSDVFAGIGHSMMDHYRGSIAGQDHGVPGNTAPSAFAPKPSLPSIMPPILPQVPQAAMTPMPTFTPNFKGIDITAISKALGGL